MVVRRIHGEGEARRRLDALAGHGGDHLVRVRRFGFFHGLRPHVDAHIGRFHGVVRHHRTRVRQLLRHRIRFPLLDEGCIHGVFDGFKVIPRRQVTKQGFGIDAAQLFLTHGKRDDGHIRGFQARIAQFLVERHVRVAIDGGNDGRLAARGKLLDVGDDGLIVGMAKWRVDLADIAILDPFAFQEGAQDLVGGARIHIVRTQQHEAFGAAAILAHQVFDGRYRLLVRCSARIKHILFQLLAFVLHRVKQQAVEFLEHG